MKYYILCLLYIIKVSTKKNLAEILRRGYVMRTVIFSISFYLVSDLWAFDLGQEILKKIQILLFSSSKVVLKLIDFELTWQYFVWSTVLLSKKELSLYQELKFSNPQIFATRAENFRMSYPQSRSLNLIILCTHFWFSSYNPLFGYFYRIKVTSENN